MKYQKIRALMILVHIIILIYCLFNPYKIVEYADFSMGLMYGMIFAIISCELLDVRAEYEFEITCKEIADKYLKE